MSDPTYTMSMIDPIAISIETQMIDNECSLQNEFSKLIYINS